MASDRLTHFGHPHMLLKTQYNDTSTHKCEICQSKLAGLFGYRCNDCDFDIHVACAENFGETISFFAHPCQLTLTRNPSYSTKWSCSLCRKGCSPIGFMYRCIDCLFDVHPVCTTVPQTIRSPLHPEHDLRLLSSPGICGGCGCEELPVWNYVCSCPFRLIGCDGVPSNGSQSKTSTTTSTDTARSSSRSGGVGLFLLKAGATAVINAATHGLASPVLDALKDTFDSTDPTDT